MATKTELAWAAGFIDGDGCIRVDGRGVLSVTAACTHKPSIVKFAEIFRYGNFSSDWRGPGRKEMWSWTVRSKDAARVLRRLIPHLITKSVEAALGLLYQASDSAPGAPRPRKKLSADIRADRYGVDIRMKQLKVERKSAKLNLNEFKPLRKRQLKDVEVAWLAGLFDAEGCLFVGANSWEVKIKMCDAKTISKVHSLGPPVKIYSGKAEDRKYPWYLWRQTGKKAVNFLRMISPYLVTRAHIISLFLYLFPSLKRRPGEMGSRALNRKAILREEIRLVESWVDIQPLWADPHNLTTARTFPLPADFDIVTYMA